MKFRFEWKIRFKIDTFTCNIIIFQLNDRSWHWLPWHLNAPDSQISSERWQTLFILIFIFIRLQLFKVQCSLSSFGAVCVCVCMYASDVCWFSESLPKQIQISDTARATQNIIQFKKRLSSVVPKHFELKAESECIFRNFFFSFFSDVGSSQVRSFESFNLNKMATLAMFLILQVSGFCSLKF